MGGAALRFARAEAVWELLGQEVRPARRVSLAPADALGCVLATDAESALDYPPFDRAVMDGYAVRSADLAGGRGVSVCAGLVRAGSVPGTGLPPGCCMQINTGAPVPVGADAVVVVERSRALGDGRIELSDQPAPQQNIEPRGAIARRGEAIVRAGRRVGPGELAALLAGGCTQVWAYPRPRVTVLGTGDEVARPGEPLRPGQVYESNVAPLVELARAAGATPRAAGCSGDDERPLREALRGALQETDVLCVTGGMSRGSHDLVPAVLEEFGIDWLVEGLDLKPGRPTRIGRTDAGVWVLGLPGNPVSCMVCFLLLGRPIITGLSGEPVRPPPHLTARLEAPLPPNGQRPLYAPGTWRVRDADGQLLACMRPWRGSGDPFAMAGANALIYRDSGAPAAAPGEPVRCVPIDLPA